MKIVQLLPSLAYGDAIGNDTFALRKTIEGMGYETEIYAQSIDKRVSGRAVSYQKMPMLSENDILLYHFSTGSAVMKELVRKQKCRKIMVYHNITPSQFFREYSEAIAEEVDQGRAELADMRADFDLCLAVSEYNKNELIQAGYECPIVVLPILMDFDDYAQVPDQKLIREYRSDDFTNFLFVGRLAPNKKQEDLIRSFAFYQTHMDANSRLILVGRPVLDNYERRLRRYAELLGVSNDVIFTGHIPFKQILAYYQVADLFLCMSEHEGFCVPLLEAMHFRVPIMAYAASAIPETLGPGAALLADKEPQHVARCAAHILYTPGVKERLLASQDKQLARFQPEAIASQFRALLEVFISGKELPACQQADNSISGLDTEQFFADGEGFVEADIPSPFIPDISSVLCEGTAADVRRSFKALQSADMKNSLKYLLRPAYRKIAKRFPSQSVALKNGVYSAYHMLRHIALGSGASLSAWERQEPYILLDTTLITEFDAKTGIQRVVNNVAKQLCSLHKNTMAIRVEYYGGAATSLKYMQRLGIECQEKKERRLSCRPGDVLFMLDSSWSFYPQLSRLTSQIHKVGGKSYGLIHDLFPVQYPEMTVSEEFVNIFKNWLSFVMREADGIICNSRTTADVVCDYFSKQGFKRASKLEIHYFPMGFDLAEADGPVRAGLQRFLAGAKTFLMVGTISPRKGHIVALEAMKKLLVDHEAQLLIIGKRGWKSDEFLSLLSSDENLSKHVLWLLDASDAELQWAYNHASALLAASHDEGFGLPLVEAAKFGLPIIASDIPIFHEVTGDKADFFKVMEADDLAKTLKKWLETDEHPSSKDIRLYTWEESARAIHDILTGKSKPYRML